jgi:hypothetical protein
VNVKRSGSSRLATALACCALSLWGCNGDDGGGGSAGGGGADMCLEDVELDCGPAFQPTFESLWENELSTCGASSTGSSCHGPDGGQAGLYLTDIDEAYDLLLDPPDTSPRVLPGDPECSPLIQRIESDDASFVMPPGTPLSESVRCAIRQWVANGAER